MRPLLLLPLLLAMSCHDDEHGHEPASSTTLYPAPATPADVKVYVAVEGAGAIMVLDGRDLAPLAKISVGEYEPHNVQVAPDGRSVWATLVSGHGHGGGAAASDRVVVIDTGSEEVVGTIDLGPDVHPAHVVLTPDSKTALVTGDTKNELIRIDAASRKITARTLLDHGGGAHGARVDRFGTAWVAEISGKCVARVGSDGQQQHVMTDGQAVQTAVTDSWIFVSQYDTRSVARIDPNTLAVTYARLPDGAEGPIQLYPADGGRKILVADQGLLAGRAPSNRLFVLDVASMTVVDTIEVGLGAHGVVADGHRAFITSLADDTVTAVDLQTKTVFARAKVGNDPNGISVWTRQGGAP